MTATTQNNVIPDALLRVAYRLARAYGHEWATMFDVDLVSNKTADEIGNLVRSACDNAYIAQPSYDPQSRAIEHTTVSKRLDWRIVEAPGDEVCLYINVYREGHLPCLHSQVYLAHLTMVYVYVYVSDHIPYRRHYRALAEALDRLGCDIRSVVVRNDRLGDARLIDLCRAPDPIEEVGRLTGLDVAAAQPWYSRKPACEYLISVATRSIELQMQDCRIDVIDLYEQLKNQGDGDCLAWDGANHVYACESAHIPRGALHHYFSFTSREECLRVIGLSLAAGY